MAVLNAANEIAVEAFLNGRIRFDQIHALNADVLTRQGHLSPNSIDDLFELDLWARAQADAWVQQRGY